jgi:hypothetical protein
VERLAAHWAEVLGGPPHYSESCATIQPCSGCTPSTGPGRTGSPLRRVLRRSGWRCRAGRGKAWSRRRADLLLTDEGGRAWRRDQSHGRRRVPPALRGTTARVRAGIHAHKHLHVGVDGQLPRAPVAQSHHGYGVRVMGVGLGAPPDVEYPGLGWFRRLHRRPTSRLYTRQPGSVHNHEPFALHVRQRAPAGRPGCAASWWPGSQPTCRMSRAFRPWPASSSPQATIRSG